ncbi:MAG: SDR family oxidoreductase [Butyrivibrio sp.]|uniref:elongation factor P 5-aminopentanone reductase n=1 Tax=Butyrivibrio sp. NC2002 TaxID=1410610 RepID=UPI000560A01D|nr:SDR family oxidoreductase [Butyrivibrio sp. NC2002]MBE5859726.1 SDR family oxidoreductase [Butyrivibrio sp.]
MNSLNNKSSVLVTGASRGIGLSIAETFAAAGHPVYMCCRSHQKEIIELSNEISDKYNIPSFAYACDIGNENDVIKLFEAMTQNPCKAPGIVINNAGVAHYGLLTDMTSKEWRDLMSTNLDSVFYVSKYAVPYMLKEGGGKIINISSVWGNVGASCEVAYSASKGGVNAFTKALAKELAPSNIQVNAIACGVIDTTMNSSHLSEDELQALTEEIPADRLGRTDEVAQLALQLANAPSYLTGQIITLDGGWI